MRAIRRGDVRLFTAELEEHAEAFIQTGTYLLVEKAKLLVSARTPESRSAVPTPEKSLEPITVSITLLLLSCVSGSP